MNKGIQIAPSVLACDFSNLRQELADISEADFIHCDIMDGHFVPNLSFGPMVISTIHDLSDIPLDVHLMVSDPAAYIKIFADAGASYISFHVEATPHPMRLIDEIREYGVHPAVVLCPATPLCVLEEILTCVDMVLIMSVNPGFGGQHFISSTLRRLKRLRRMCDEKGASPLIEVDGGVTFLNAADICAAGANVLVAGTTIFNSSNHNDAINKLRHAAYKLVQEEGPMC